MHLRYSLLQTADRWVNNLLRKLILSVPSYLSRAFDLLAESLSHRDQKSPPVFSYDASGDPLNTSSASASRNDADENLDTQQYV